MIKIYTDGGFSIPRGAGGWAMVVVDDSLPITQQVLLTKNGTEKDSTSNRMELTAFLNALEYIVSNNLTNVEIITDSNYTVQGYNVWSKNWKKRNWKKGDGKDVLNKDLWLLIDSVRVEGVNARWTKGHNAKGGTMDDLYNDMVDKLTRDYV